MKVYIKCEKCNGNNCPKHSYSCFAWREGGFAETEIPVEQALKALKGGHKELIILFESMDISENFRPVSLISRMEEAIQALEECLK